MLWNKKSKKNLLPNGGGETWVIYLGREVNISPKNTSQVNGHRINGLYNLPGTLWNSPTFGALINPPKTRFFSNEKRGHVGYNLFTSGVY